MFPIKHWSPPDLRPLFAPRSIAIIGASEKTGKRGHEVLDNLRQVGFRGAIYPVNPHYERVDGLPCFASVAAIPAEVEAAAIALPAAATVEAVQQCVQKGVRAAVVVAAGFAESISSKPLERQAGDSGSTCTLHDVGGTLQAELVSYTRRGGMLLGGPNCLGVWSLPDHCAYWVCSPVLEATTGLAAILQSGALVASLTDPAAERGLLFNTLATVGNEAMLTAGDYLAYMIEKPHIRAVALVIEDVRHPETFLYALHRAALLGKPVMILKLGRTEAGRKAALAHTASLAGERVVIEAVLRQYGALLVDDLDELMEILALIDGDRMPKGERFVAVTVSGAGSGLVADLAGAAGLTLGPLSEQSQAALSELLPSQIINNPVDVAGAGDQPELYRRCFAALASDPEIDILAVAQNTPWGRTPVATAFYSDHARAAVATGANTDKLVFTFSLTSGMQDPQVTAILHAGHIPVLQGARESLKAVALLIRYTNWRRTFLQQENADTDRASAQVNSARQARARALLQEAEQAASANLVLSYPISSALLSLYGLPTARSKLVHSGREAAEVVAQWRKPVTLKLLSPDLPHKTEYQLVALAIDSPVQAELAGQKLLAHASVLAQERPVQIEGLLVQEMISGGPELIAGLARDEQFGLLVALGWGGTLVEAQRAFTLRLPPFDDDQAYQMIAELPYQEVVRGYRGLPSVDTAAVAALLLNLNTMAQELGEEIDSLDLNPIINRGLGHGVAVVDALMIRRGTQCSGT